MLGKASSRVAEGLLAPNGNAATAKKLLKPVSCQSQVATSQDTNLSKSSFDVTDAHWIKSCNPEFRRLAPFHTLAGEVRVVTGRCAANDKGTPLLAGTYDLGNSSVVAFCGVPLFFWLRPGFLGSPKNTAFAPRRSEGDGF